MTSPEGFHETLSSLVFERNQRSGESYRPLDHEKQEIRLIRLLPSSRRQQYLSCELTMHSLLDFTQDYLAFLMTENRSAKSHREIASEWLAYNTPSDWAKVTPLRRISRTRPPCSTYRFAWGDFAALSYVWGDKNNTSTLVINGKPTQVTANLMSALRQFQADAEFEDGFKLWVDAISINQKNPDERAYEVQRMRDIYGRAWTVVAWLGLEADQSNLAIRLVKDLAAFSETTSPNSLEQRLRMEPNFLGKGCWTALESLVNREYFFRLWIMQEVVMGASATWMRCGSAQMDWFAFCRGISLLKEHLWLIKDHLLQKEALEAGLSSKSRVWRTPSLHLIYHDLSVLT